MGHGIPVVGLVEEEESQSHIVSTEVSSSRDGGQVNTRCERYTLPGFLTHLFPQVEGPDSRLQILGWVAPGGSDIPSTHSVAQ